MRLNTTGLGIGTSSPSSKLHVKLGGVGDDSISLVESSGSSTYGVYIKSAYAEEMGRVGALSQADGGLDGASIAFRDYGRDIVFNTHEGASNSEKVRIKKDGKVGLGTSSPSYRLHLHNVGGGDGIALQDSNDAGSTGLHFLNNSGTIVAEVSGLSDNTGMTFETAGTERARIDSSGNFGIKNSNPTATLTVGTLSSGQTGNVVINNEGGNTATLEVLSRTNRSVLKIADNDTIGYMSAENGILSIGRSSGLSANNINIDSSHRVGIGVTSPDTLTHIAGAAGSAVLRLENTDSFLSDGEIVGKIEFETQDSGGAGVNAYIQGVGVSNNGATRLDFGTGGQNSPETRMTINSNGNVGIGETSPQNPLHVRSDSASGENYAIQIDNNNTTVGSQIGMLFRSRVGTTNTDFSIRGIANGSDDMDLTFNSDGGTERARIDSSGNVLVGKTSTSGSTAGISLKPNGQLEPTVSGSYVSYFNRTSSSGVISYFAKDGTLVGGIGTGGTDLWIGSPAGAGSVGIKLNSKTIIPTTDAGADQDNAIDIGNSSVRFKDIYATNGTIQTSDINEKQDIEDLSEAETRVAVAAKELLKKYRWKSAVADKGDDARIHFGIMAQDLENAFANEGLDAGDYGMFISTTWTDEATGEEKTRLGVRYNELLAFIIAAI